MQNLVQEQRLLSQPGTVQYTCYPGLALRRTHHSTKRQCTSLHAGGAEGDCVADAAQRELAGQWVETLQRVEMSKGGQGPGVDANAVSRPGREEKVGVPELLAHDLLLAPVRFKTRIPDHTLDRRVSCFVWFDLIYFFLHFFSLGSSLPGYP
ncbi:hypothetical protein B0J15DRAFT_459172 [Fusarium solani]|uniref:Uncharacterized protein n=1 Tax=Fusarium solani TaxID=169388 RepID=A0A9P9L3M4_FUSSL|nr:uncharacterized protein B0J15DRAFT_459172 [Fusarium solani]KAH7274110.1 hypothetical protein B0J15DRAFT_459172 [Fusarium solani]